MNDFDENLFSERYRIKTARLPNWNYAKPGYYFITICTQFKKPHFGYINNGRMILSANGKIADDCWRKIPCHFNNMELDAFVVMPNHVHGIVRIIEKHSNNGIVVETCHCMSLRNTQHATIQNAIHGISRNTQYGPVQNTPNKFSQPISGSIPMIINHYKGACTRTINKTINNPYFFHWQSRYHDHIIKNHHELNIIRAYIINNPRKWELKRKYCPFSMSRL